MKVDGSQPAQDATEWVDALVEDARRITEFSLRTAVRDRVKDLLHRTGIHSALQRLWSGEVAILFIHKVHASPVGLWGEPVLSVDILKRQLEFLTRTYEVVRLSDLVRALRGEAPFPRRAVVLTFDDGYRNNLTRAAPLFSQLHVPATLFVTTGLIGTDEWMWGYQLEEIMFRYSPLQFGYAANDPIIRSICERGLSKYTALLACVEYLKRIENARRLQIVQSITSKLPVELDEDNRFLTWDELRELPQHGFDIGAHTVTHPILTKLTREQLEWEVGQCRETLERETGVRPTLFSYPNGDSSPAVTEAVARYFEAAVNTHHACSNAHSPLLALPRIFMPPTEAELAYVLTRQFLAAGKAPATPLQPVPPPRETPQPEPHDRMVG